MRHDVFRRFRWVLGLSVAAWSLPASADVKTAHGTACVPDEFVLADGAWNPHFNGLAIDPGSIGGGALCSITRDDSLQPMDEVQVSVDPSTTSVTCYVVSIAQTGYLSAYEYSDPRTSSGSSPQILTFSGSTMTNLDEYDNGTYHVECSASSPFTLLSVWWQEN